MALVSSVATAIMTLTVVFIRQIVGTVSDIVVWVGKRTVGGRFADKSFLNNYLNWMVVEYHDLNLTGIIGSGPKPRLEQVFISLNLSEESESSADQVHKGIAARAWERVKSVLQLRDIKQPQAHTPEAITFYQTRRAYRIKQFFERREEFFLLLVLLVIAALLTSLVVLLPAYILFWSVNPQAWQLILTGLIWGLAVILLIQEVIQDLRRGGVRIGLTEGAVLGGYILLTGLLIQSRGVSLDKATFALAGVGTSVIALFLRHWIISRRSRIEGEFGRQVRGLLTQHTNIAILGKPGAGKSTFVQFLALTFAREKAGDKKLRRRGVVREQLGLDRWHLPILIPLRKVSKALLERDADGSANLLLEAWRDKVLPSDIRADYHDRFFLKMLASEQCIFLLDGLDEVANEEEFRTVIREIRGFSSRYAGNRFIITSRFSGWRGGVGSSFREFQVNDLSDDQISAFINDWYQAIEENRILGGIEAETATEKAQRLRKARSRAEDLRKALEEVESIRRLAENPLLLSIICFVHYHKTLPRERLSLYQDCSNLLLLQWDREKGLPADDTNLTLKQKEAIMQEIAFAMHIGRIGNEYGGKEATSKDIIPIVAEKLRHFRLPVEDAATLFQKLIDRSGIMVSVERYADRSSFSHLTFQEFYTAKYIFENRLDILAHFADESVERLSGWWREVVLLYVSMIKDSSRFIQEMCEPTSVALDDMANRRLQIVAQCLLQAVSVQEEGTEQKILQDLINIRLGAQCNINVDSDSPRELKTYLLNFANTSDFYEHALQFTVDQLRGSIDLDSLMQELINLSKSADSDLATAALRAIRTLTTDYNLQNAISLDDLMTLFEQPSERVKAEVLHLVCANSNLATKWVLLDGTIPAVIEDEYHYRSEFDEVQIQLVRQLPKMPYSAESDKQRVRRTLWETFYKLERTKLRAAVAASIVLMSTEREQVSYMADFLDMLRTGSLSDQCFAVEVLAVLLQEMEHKEAIDQLIQSLCSPHESVRWVSVKALTTTTLSRDQTNQIAAVLERGLQVHTFPRRVLAYLIQSLQGEGQIGTGFDEKLHLISALTELNGDHDHAPEDPQNLALSLMDEENVWHFEEVIQTFEALNRELTPETASKLMQLYDNLSTQIGEEGRLVRVRRTAMFGIGRMPYFSFVGPKDYLVGMLVRLARLSSVEVKRQMAGLLFEETEALRSSVGLRALRDLELEPTAIPEEYRVRILALLEHKEWQVADAAFELAVQYGLV